MLKEVKNDIDEIFYSVPQPSMLEKKYEDMWKLWLLEDEK